MRILYGVVGEGMGHATRSRVILEHLLKQGHDVHVVVSGKAHEFLVDRLRGYTKLTIDEIHGFTLRYFDNSLDRSSSLFHNLRKAPKGVAKNVKVYRKVVEKRFRPDLVISDFESWAALYGINHRLPVVSIDNMQIINRCKHPKEIRGDSRLNYQLVKLAVKMKVPGAYHYLVSSFFFPPVKKKRTTLVPPILRPEVLEAKREPGDHVLVYQRFKPNEELLPTFRKLPCPVRIYGAGKVGVDGNVEMRAFSETQFVDDLRTARAVIAGGGFTLMSEAVTLHVPMLTVPVGRQYEQELNAMYLESLGYGRFAKDLDPEIVIDFVKHTDEHAHALERYERHDNSMTFACLDELVIRCADGEKRPVRLDAQSMGGLD